MAWVKKNLFFLIAAVVSLGVLGYAFVFVNGKKAADAEVAASLDDAAQKYKTLIDRKVHPGTEKVNNIQNAKDEVVRLNAFMDEMREYLKGPEAVTNLNNQEFRAQLDTSIAQMRRAAEEAGVALPNTNYWFTFTSYKTTVDFKGDAPGMLAQLNDLRAIMDVLNQARVHSVVALRRVPVSDTDNTGTGDYIPNRAPKTNDFAITTGYEVTFQGFSSELARVMEGLANAKQCFVVKSVGVANAPEERKPATAAPMMMAPPMMMNPYQSDARYRMGNMRPQVMMPAPPPTQRTAQPNQPKTILDENKLRFTLQVDSVRLKPKSK